jgi:hypothetical protein
MSSQLKYKDERSLDQLLKELTAEKSIKSNCKLVLFNRRETEFACDKIEYENELWALRDLFYAAPKVKSFLVEYWNALDEVYSLTIKGVDKNDVRKKFLNAYGQNVEFKVQLKSITEQ